MRDAPDTTSHGRPRSNLALRLLTAAVSIPAIAWATFDGPDVVWFCVPGVTVLLAAFEFFGMSHPGDRAGRALGTTLAIALYGLLVATRMGDAGGAPALGGTLALAPAALLFALCRPLRVDEALAGTAALVMGPIYLGAPMAALAVLRGVGTHEQGAGLVALAIAFAWMSDSTAYFVGRALKGPKLYPSVSPNKTWSGAIGGLVGAVLGATIAHWWFLPSLPFYRGMLLSLFAATLGQAGDLAESMLKRSARVKDSGGILPGHGGMLDRVDALLVTSLVTWAAIRFGLVVLR
jgi:phosphatidate cytidylyltransferase